MRIKPIVIMLAGSIAITGCKQKQEPPAVSSEAPSAAEAASAPIIAVRRDPAPEARLIAKSEVLNSDPAFTSLSVEEANWLKRNGFLSRDELRDLQALGEQALLERSREKGDPAAATALGMLRLRGGDTAGAMRAFQRAANLGSLYALEQLAYAELLDFQSSPGQRDIASEQNAQALFVARMEQARIMGDHRVDYYINQVASGLDRQRYGDQILRQTTEFMRQMGADAATRGVAARGPDARPNIDVWQAAELDPNGTISAGIR